ncbi:Probable LRR receptor-like serine/threonine-protein kinase At2g16250 [Linum grandiflorum]
MVDPVKAFALIVLNLVVLWFQPTFQQQRLTSGVERAALFQLRSDLGIRSREWPRRNDPCLGWVGVQCANGSVVGINISGFRRTRLGSRNPQFALDALANFTQLTSFIASRFLLPGSIPDSFGETVSSTSLQILDLSSCDIANAVPESLGDLSSLSELRLGGNRLTGIIPSNLGQLLQLSVLNLSRNLFTGSIPPTFVNLVNLRSLDMSSNFLAGSIPPIGALSNLAYLNLSNNSLSSSVPVQFGSLVGLVDLDLTRNSLSGALPVELTALSSLKSLLLGNNSIGGSLPSGLFANQTQLQNVVLSNNDFTGSVPPELLSIPGLQLLDLSGNNFTGMLLSSSNSNANSTAAVLNISGNQFYGGLGDVLRRFSFVDLSGNYFQGPVPNYVLNNASLGRNCLRNVTNQKSVFDCSLFYSNLGLTFDNFGLPNSTEPGSPVSRKKSKRNLIILVSVLGGIGLLLLIFFIVVLVFCLRKRDSSNQRGVAVEPAPSGTAPPPPEASINFSILGDTFTYQQLLQATGEFNAANLIKNGHSGDIYRGILENGIPVAVKRIDLSAIKKESYLVELDFFSKVAHAKVVPLLGHCLENENEKLLVYKYMPNGDLASSLFRKTSSEDDTLKSLDWITRLKIAIGAAEALSCLHHECTPPIVHRDIQASSILLDDKFEVRLGSLSEVCAQEGDAHQSRITRLLRLPSSDQGTSAQPSATCTYDVYCFGKVLLELVTGNIGISSANDTQLKEYLDQIIPHISMYEKELVVKIVDPSLIIDEDLLEEVWAMAIVARSCLNPKPSRRPLMRYILKALENPLKVVREEAVDSSARLRTTSSRGSWNAAVFSSWRQSSDVTVVPPGQSAVGVGSSSRPEGGSRSSGGRNGSGSSSSHRRGSREIFPEPVDAQDVERRQHD